MMHGLGVVPEGLLREPFGIAALKRPLRPRVVANNMFGAYSCRMKTKSSIKSAQRQAIVWGRFSSDQQKDGDSKDRQDRLNHALAKREGIQIVGEHFDPAASVKDGATPLFKKIIADLPQGVGIICENLDRINRGHPWRAKAYIADILEAGHFIITSCDGREYNQQTIEELDTMVMGDMASNVARYENNKRTTRVLEEKKNAVALARQGEPAPLGAWLPAHLKFNPVTNQYDIRQDRKAIIHKIFKDYASGKGVVSITGDLNLARIPTFRGKKIGKWQRTTIFTLLRYEGIIGVLNYKDERIVNAFPPAIDEKLFYKVQAILETNKAKHGNYKSNNVNNILRGLCKCPHCGSGMIVTRDNYLACSGYQQKRCTIKNMLRGYNEIEFEFAKWFVPAAKDVLLGKDNSSYAVEALIAKRNALTGRIEKTLTLLDDDTMPAVEIKSRLAKLEAERINIENEIATTKANQSINATLPETFKELDTLINGVLDNQDIRKQVSGVIPTIVRRVDIDIADKLFPSFTVHLINGENIEWQYDIVEFSQPIRAFGKNGTMLLGKGRVLEGGYQRK